MMRTFEEPGDEGKCFFQSIINDKLMICFIYIQLVIIINDENYNGNHMVRWSAWDLKIIIFMG